MTLREDVRSALERQQSRLGDIGDARPRLMQGASAAREQHPSSRSWQWAAAVAAVLIAAIVITTFALVKGGSHTTAVPAATPSPRAQASPTPLANELNVPDTTPIVIYSDPANYSQVDGMTWDGKTAGKLTGVVLGPANPGNSLFGGQLAILNRHGQTVYTGYFGGKLFGGTWSDDGAHVCVLVPQYLRGGTANDVPTVLQLIALGGSTRNVAVVGRSYEQAYPYVAACSPGSDRAIVVQPGGQGVGTVQYWVVRMSTGKVLWTHTFDITNTLVTVVASRDAAYVAEDLSSAGQPAGSTVYGPDGKPLAALSDRIDAFSWDGSLALVDSGQGVGAPRFINWQTRQMVWAAPYRYDLVAVIPQPDGSGMAIWVKPSSQASLHSSLYVVSGTGAVVADIAGASPPSS